MKLDKTSAIVLDGLEVGMLGHLHKDEGDLASLVLKADIHTLGQESFSDRALDLAVALTQAFDADLLLDHLGELPNLILDAGVDFAYILLELLVIDEELGSGNIDFSVFLALLGVVRLVTSGGHLSFLFSARIAVRVVFGRRGDVSFIDELLELVREVLVEVHVEGDLLALLGEDVAGQEDVEGVVHASAKILDSLPIVLLLLPLPLFQLN